jgi:hypothetical protein
VRKGSFQKCAARRFSTWSVGIFVRPSSSILLDRDNQLRLSFAWADLTDERLAIVDDYFRSEFANAGVPRLTPFRGGGRPAHTSRTNPGAPQDARHRC